MSTLVRPQSNSSAPSREPQRANGRIRRTSDSGVIASDGDSKPNSTESSQARGGFLFSPAIDLFFVANAFWPLLLMVDCFGGLTTHQSLLFWQIYFVTAPHRWITLVLVSVDHHKGRDRRRQFLAFGTAILIGCLCLKLGTGSLLCLGVIDYVWNAWHFASQHHGVFRIYQRKSNTGRAIPPAAPSRLAVGFEKALFRGFMLYTIARVAGWGWTEGPFEGFQWVSTVDWFALAIPAGLVIRQLIQCFVTHDTSLASVMYLSSVMTLFASLLLASHYENSQYVVALALASAIFHSLEYMSIVTWSMSGPQTSGKTNPLVRLSQMWLLFLVMFVVVIGLGNYALSRGYFELWVFINIVVAFWHYCFDGMIWKSRKSSAKTAHRAPVAT
ncbi:hypothetical protein [Allorhodopirellula heiligendammensis]|uniref:Uncharacterized protein n=1 Tax=Allorhodopirellula heiligendammensis TaxID=2714739 RepID=A0A5C6C2B2_9BACT|nr:hypothetical protein [Allorhodopirellula heiligendammensis]TWU18225.1 hypothetical protein Poly21_03800 [Allorhodopirellula heiligendammensis]